MEFDSCQNYDKYSLKIRIRSKANFFYGTVKVLMCKGFTYRNKKIIN